MPLEALRRLDVESILKSIKKMLGIADDQTNFDADLIIHINSVFMTLHQLGVGPSGGYFITDELAIWDNFLPEDMNLNLVKTYMYLKVKLLFDPPLSSSVLDSMERMAGEFEWRLKVESETY